ncbi:hypothetical protein [Nocardioides luteus]|nr:hypothetical protein [Nocardioides luteus]
MSEMLTLDGKLVDWSKPPRQTDLVLWSRLTSGGKQVKGSARTIAHLCAIDAAAQMKFGTRIVVIQAPFNTTVPASAGTHDHDACTDLHIPGVNWRTQEKWLRANGYACWYRFPPTFGHHIHGFTLPPQSGVVRSDDFRDLGVTVGKFVDGGSTLFGSLVTSSQLEDYYHHAFGLKGMHGANTDEAWHPTHIEKTIFDYAAFARSKAKPAWTPKDTKSNLAIIQQQFQIAAGLRKGKRIRTNGVGWIQKALNAKAGANLVVNGIVDSATLAAWKKFEIQSGGTGAKTTPDPKGLKKLQIAFRFVGPEAHLPVG